MTCAELRSRLDAYVRGTLAAGEAAALEAHLSGCAECSRFLEAGEPARTDLGELPRTVEPPSELWPGIQARLTPARRGRRGFRVSGWSLAAAALLLIAVSTGVTLLLVRSATPAENALATSAPLAPLEVQYAGATAELSATLDAARGRLAPATIAVIKRNLAVIDSALAESRRALAADPGNATLERLVIGAWRQKMDLLRRAAALDSES